MNLRGPRVLVRPALARDADFIQQLVDELPQRGDSMRLWERHVIERTDDDTAVGFVELQTGDPADDWATFGPMVMTSGERGWGYGSEAVHLIEARLARRDGVRRIRALIDKRIGLAFYFWLRQGYRSPASDEAFWPNDQPGDIISVIRTLEE